MITDLEVLKALRELRGAFERFDAAIAPYEPQLAMLDRGGKLAAILATLKPVGPQDVFDDCPEYSPGVSGRLG